MRKLLNFLSCNWTKAARVAALSIFLLAWPPTTAAAQQTPAAKSPADQLRQAQELIDAAKSTEALILLNNLAQQDPSTPGLQAMLGKTYYEKRDFSNAIQHLNAALEQKADDGESLQLLGLAHYLSGHLKEAIPLLEKVQTMLPHPDVTGSYILGISYLQTYQYDKARAAFAKMFSVPPDSPGAHVVLGQMMLRQEFEDKAVPELQKALELDPKIPMAHFLLGEIYLYKSNIPAALEEFHKELATNPIEWRAYWRMGDAYTRIEKWNQAEDALKQAVWLNQDFSAPYILLGKVELKKGDAQLATGFLERALKMDPNNFSAHYLLGQAYKQLGRAQEADKEFEMSRQLHGDQK